MRILTVDDDEMTIDILREFLTGEGYAVDAAATGEEGEILAESAVYDLIILDVTLPGKNGLEVCESLRQKNIQTPVMLLTGKRVEELDQVQGLNRGADDYFLKPIHPGVFLARVSALLRRGPIGSHPGYANGSR